MKKAYLCLFCCLFTKALLYAQGSIPKPTQLSTFIAADLTYFTSDKLLTSSLNRRWVLGGAFRDKHERFVVFLGGGIKAMKINLYSPDFKADFIKAVQTNYKPIQGSGEDSAIAASLYSYKKYDLWGNYGACVQGGVQFLKNKCNPQVSVMLGFSNVLLHSKAIASFEDPKYQDIDYVGMTAKYIELKVGAALPRRKKRDEVRNMHFSIGYKFTDYGHLTFKDIPLSAYTTGDLAHKYRFSGVVTFSIAFSLMDDFSK